MSTETESKSKEQRILRMVKKVITDIAKDTHTPPGMRHPLSDSTINSMRACLGLIISREAELVARNGKISTGKPRFIDDSGGSVIAQLKTGSESGNKNRK